MNKYQCGNGWFAYKNTPVYERPDGLRIHLIGLLRLPDGTKVNIDHSKLWKYENIKGGCRRRGLMALATKEYPQEKAHDI